MLTHLRLQNFRSYTDSVFEFNDGVTIIVGPNASGKTNLLEAILVLASGRSYRAKDDELVRQGKEWLRLEGATKDGERVVKIETQKTPSKSFVVNGANKQRLTHNTVLPVVLFEPDHLRLVSGGPQRRRDYLDEQLEQTTIGYKKLRRDYARTLAQRNRLLKQTGPSARGQLFAWDVRLSELAAQIATERAKLAGVLDKKAPGLYRRISKSKRRVRFGYQTPFPLENYSSALLNALEKSRETDFERGFTGAGPHREDLYIEIDGQPVQAVASRGESRTIVLALKLQELHNIEASTNKKPLLLLDDVFSELDGARRHALTEFLKPYQTFITTTDADIVVQHFMKEYSVIPTSG